MFGNGIKYPLWRFAGWPERLMRKHLYLNFAGYKRSRDLMPAHEGDIEPAFQSVRERGLDAMYDASALHSINSKRADVVGAGGA
jgi:hypothetical protein